jgi:hypothetical protein
MLGRIRLRRGVGPGALGVRGVSGPGFRFRRRTNGVAIGLAPGLRGRSGTAAALLPWSHGRKERLALLRHRQAFPTAYDSERRRLLGAGAPGNGLDAVLHLVFDYLSEQKASKGWSEEQTRLRFRRVLALLREAYPDLRTWGVLGPSEVPMRSREHPERRRFKLRLFEAIRAVTESPVLD